MEHKVSKAKAIREYIAANPTASAKQVAEALKVNLQYVYLIKSSLGQKTTVTKSKRGRPAKTLITQVTALPMDRSSYVDGMKQRIRHLELELELQGMVVNALKSRLYAASI